MISHNFVGWILIPFTLDIMITYLYANLPPFKCSIENVLRHQRLFTLGEKSYISDTFLCCR
jgi:hypothetical protein